MNIRQIVVPTLGVLALGAAIASMFSSRTGLVARKVSYPYVCDACRAVFDVSELKEDYPQNWRIPKGAPSDSVVVCLRCNKGWAYPVAKCETCGTEYILHMVRNSRCPKCFPEVAAAAKKKGIDLVFQRK